MAKVLITGFREYDFTDDETGERVEGMSVFFREKQEPRAGKMAGGYSSGKLSIKKDSPMYGRMLNASYDKPFEAECIYDIVPGRRRAVLTDIKF